MTKPTVVALCMPIYGKIDPRNFDSYRFLERAEIKWHHLSVIGWPVDVARNMLTAEALSAPDVTHLLFIDDDMVYPANTLKRMLAHDVDIVGGLCFDRRPPYKPVIARYFDPSWGYDEKTYGWLFDYPPDEVIEVDATGGALLLIRREVFEGIREQETGRAFGPPDKLPQWKEELPESWTLAISEYKGWWTPLDTGLSEDLSFCQRAQAAGYKLRVDTGLKIGHVGEVVVDEAFARRNRAFEYHRWHPPLEALAEAVYTRNDAIAHEIEPAMQLDAPVASIVIPTYNQKPEWLRAAVLSALAQTMSCEVIVVDDHSTPAAYGAIDVPEVDESIRQNPLLKWYRHVDENLGIAAALNKGIKSATTDWIAWLSSDDLYEPEKIERHLTALLSANRLCGYTGYNLKTDNNNGGAHVHTLLWADLPTQRRILARNCAINGSTMLVHKSVFDDVGLFDTTLRYGQDWDMWRRIGTKYLWHGIPDKLTTRREFENLTAKLMGEKNQRKTEEDEIVMQRYGAIDRSITWIEDVRRTCGLRHGAEDGRLPCRTCVENAVAKLFAEEGK